MQEREELHTGREEDTPESSLVKIQEIFDHLPLARQEQILEFAEFILVKHLEEIKVQPLELDSVQQSLENHVDTEVSPEFVSFLKARAKNHKENRDKAKTWEQLEKELYSVTSAE